METIALVIGIAIIFFVPALVWITVIAGLIQVVREKIATNQTASCPKKS